MKQSRGFARSSFQQDAFRRFCKNKLAVVGFCVVLLMLLLAIFAPVIVWHNPYVSMTDASGIVLKNQPPLLNGTLLGTDSLGRDIFSRVVYGARVSMSVGVVAVGIATMLGILLGSIAGFYGGWIDQIVMRTVDVVYCFPVLFLVITISTILKPSIINVMIIIGLCNWTGMARLVRGEILRVREYEYVQASVSLGAKDLRIICSHIILNVLAPIVVEATLLIADAILTEAALSYLGVGVQPPQASWGNMLNDANNLSTLTMRPWQWVPPGICILLTVLSINFIGDGLRDALDARQKNK